jgi:hypothetical protein
MSLFSAERYALQTHIKSKFVYLNCSPCVPREEENVLIVCIFGVSSFAQKYIHASVQQKDQKYDTRVCRHGCEQEKTEILNESLDYFMRSHNEIENRKT